MRGTRPGFCRKSFLFSMASAGGISSPRARGTGSAPIAIGGRDPPPIFFSSCRKENGPWTVQKKRALFGKQRKTCPLSQAFIGFRRNQSAPCSWPRAFRFAKRYLVGISYTSLVPLRHLRAKSRRFAAVALRNARLRAGVLSPPAPLRWAPAGAPCERQSLPASLRQAINSKGIRETTTFLFW